LLCERVSKGQASAGLLHAFCPWLRRLIFAIRVQKVRSRSLGLGFCFGRGQSRDSFASRTKKELEKLWKAGREQRLLLRSCSTPLKVYWTRMPHQGGATQKIPYRPVIGTAAPRRPPPLAARRASALVPSHCPPVAHPAFQSCVNTFASTPSCSPASPRPSEAQRSLLPTHTSPRARTRRSQLLILGT